MIYQNGNYQVIIEEDGTKIRKGDNPTPEYPESIDVKITNKCDSGCLWCHEMSEPDGLSFNVDRAIEIFKEMPGGELAIGGGNPLECKNDFVKMQEALPHLLLNMTVNSRHLSDMDILPNALGISYEANYHQQIVEFAKTFPNQIVIHLIAGKHSLQDFANCLNDFERILVLGYKRVGRGEEFYSDFTEMRLAQWYRHIEKFFCGILAFDNLALEQLGIKRFFTKEKWDEIYMGDDGSFSMYIDMAKEEFGVSSTSPIRHSIGDMKLKDMFSMVRGSCERI